MRKWETLQLDILMEKIWDLHNKLSDTIHSISRSHFTHSHSFFPKNAVVSSSAIADAKSLDSIRSALEHLEDHLDFFHTVQIQQRAERDAALARVEQSRIILALKLAEHNGKRYEVIDEALDFVGDVRDASCYVGPQASAPLEQKGLSSNVLVRVLLSSFDSAKRTLQLDKMGGVLGNAALFAFSMLALLHLHQVTSKDSEVLQIGLQQGRNGKRGFRPDGIGSSSTWQSHLDVHLARG